jgi:CTD small phosphatase-like protein 2
MNTQQVNSDNEVTRKEREEVIEDALSTLPFRHLIFSPTLDIEKFRKHLTMSYKGLLYAINSLRSPSERFLKSK